ncbi:MAG: hypothetical protein KKG00_04475, partial [Bacteroidetes bacterium]|nr:hypothetical protein [Bacteroidota bacterium]
MKTIPFLLFLVIGTASAYGQTEISYDSLTDIHQYTYRAQLYDYNANNQQNSYRTVAIKGSAFLFNTWQNGTVPLQNNRSLKVSLNYNVMEDRPVILINEEQQEVFP